MAAGASSPELFASMIGVITHSEVGVGTVVGSELFNILVIVGSVCILSPGLELDWRILVRETSFFTLSLILLLIVLHDSKVEKYEAIGLLVSYSSYVVVCKYYRQIMAALCSADPTQKASRKRELQEEFSPRITEQFEDGDLFEMEGAVGHDQTLAGGASPRTASRQSTLENVPRTFSGSDFGMDYEDALMHGFLWKKSDFYSKMRQSAKKWQRRWTVLDESSMRYVKKSGSERVILAAAQTWATATIVRTSPTEFSIQLPDNTIGFKAQTAGIARAWVSKLEARVQHFYAMDEAMLAQIDSQMDVTEEGAEEEEHGSVSSLPPRHGRSSAICILPCHTRMPPEPLR